MERGESRADGASQLHWEQRDEDAAWKDVSEYRDRVGLISPVESGKLALPFCYRPGRRVQHCENAVSQRLGLRGGVSWKGPAQRDGHDPERDEHDERDPEPGRRHAG